MENRDITPETQDYPVSLSLFELIKDNQLHSRGWNNACLEVEDYELDSSLLLIIYE